MRVAAGWVSTWECALQVSLMLTDDPTEDADALEPEVRPRFQHEWEAQQQGAPASAVEAAAPKRGRGKPGRGGKWQVCTGILPLQPFLAHKCVMSGDHDIGNALISMTGFTSFKAQLPHIILTNDSFLW